MKAIRETIEKHGRGFLTTFAREAIIADLEKVFAAEIVAARDKAYESGKEVGKAEAVAAIRDWTQWYE